MDDAHEPHGPHGPHGHGHGHARTRAPRWRAWLQPHSHDPADSMDAAADASGEGIRAIKISLVALGVTAALQAVVVVISGSVALFADTVHNLSDALTAVPLWIAFVIGRRAVTRRYTYGYGRAEDLAGVVIVAAISLSAVVAGVESVRRLFDPQEVTALGWVMAAGVVGFAGNELVAIYRIRVGRRIGSAALVADGLHARTDALTSLAVVGGAVGVALGFPIADPLVGLAITAAILLVLRGAVTSVWRRLMDAVDPDVLAAAERVLAAQPDVVAVERVRMRWLGHKLVADADVLVDGDLSIGQGHRVAHAASDALMAGVPRLVDATVHVGPAPAETTDPDATPMSG